MKRQHIVVAYLKKSKRSNADGTETCAVFCIIMFRSSCVKSIIQSPFPGGSWAAYGKHPARAFPLTAPTPKDVPLIRTLFRY